jgi:hypothetical protein
MTNKENWSDLLKKDECNRFEILVNKTIDCLTHPYSAFLIVTLGIFCLPSIAHARAKIKNTSEVSEVFVQTSNTLMKSSENKNYWKAIRTAQTGKRLSNFNFTGFHNILLLKLGVSSLEKPLSINLVSQKRKLFSSISKEAILPFSERIFPVAYPQNFQRKFFPVVLLLMSRLSPLYRVISMKGGQQVEIEVSKKVIKTRNLRYKQIVVVSCTLALIGFTFSILIKKYFRLVHELKNQIFNVKNEILNKNQQILDLEDAIIFYLKVIDISFKAQATLVNLVENNQPGNEHIVVTRGLRKLVKNIKKIKLYYTKNAPTVTYINED